MLLQEETHFFEENFFSDIRWTGFNDDKKYILNIGYDGLCLRYWS